MLSVRPGLGITTHLSKIGSSLIEPSGLFLGRKNIRPSAFSQPLLGRIEPIATHAPLIRSTASQIGWDSWQSGRIDLMASRLKVDRTELNLLDGGIDVENLDPLTTIFNMTSDEDNLTEIEYFDRADSQESSIIFNDDRAAEFASESQSIVPKISNRIDRQEGDSISVGDRSKSPINDSISSEITIDRLVTPTKFDSTEHPPTPIDLPPTIFHERELIEADEAIRETNFTPDRISPELTDSISIDRYPVADGSPNNIDLLHSAVRTAAELTDSIPTLPDNVKSEKISSEIVGENLPQPHSSRSDLDLPPTIFHAGEVERESPANVAEGSSSLEMIADSQSTIIDDPNDLTEARSADNLTIDRTSSETSSRSEIDPPATIFLPGNESVAVMREFPANFGDKRESRAEPIVDRPSPASLDPELPPTIWRDEIEVVADPPATNLPPLPVNLAPDALELATPQQLNLPRSVPERPDIAQPAAISPLVDDVELPVNLSPTDNSAETEIDRLSPATLDLPSIDLPPTVFLAANEPADPALALPPSLVPNRIIPAEEATTNLDLPLPEVPIVDTELPTNLAREGGSLETVVNFSRLSLETEIDRVLPPIENQEITGFAAKLPVNSALDRTSSEPKIENQPPTIFHEPMSKAPPGAHELSETIIPISTLELGSENISPIGVVNNPAISQFPPDTTVIENIERTPTIFRDSPELDATIVRQSVPGTPIDEGRSPPVSDDLDERFTPQNEGENILPVKGYATGGQVADIHSLSDIIHPSDTVAAMLTPKEFVVNVRDAQKNINLLEHINSGGELAEFTPPNPPATIFLDSTPSPESSPEIATKVESFADPPLQLKRDNLQRSPLLADSIEDRQSSILDRPLPHNLASNPVVARESIVNYAAPPLIFRKSKSVGNLPATKFTDPPTQWNSVEDLIGGNDDLTTIFNFPETGGENVYARDPRHSQSSNSAAPDRHQPSTVSRFASDDLPIARDIATEIEPITETISAPAPPAEKKDDPGELETLAREIYHRLRQRLEVERERQGIYNGRLPW
jgi:hypothetical protein